MLTRSTDKADDLVQVAIARALERTDQWEPGSRADLWLFRIIRSVWINQTKAARLRRTESVEDHDCADVSDGVAAMEARLTLKEVQTAFARLPEDQRQALFLVSVEEYSYREAAAMLNVPIGTVISRLARGRAALVQSAGRTTAGRVVLLREKATRS